MKETVLQQMLMGVYYNAELNIIAFMRRLGPKAKNFAEIGVDGRIVKITLNEWSRIKSPKDGFERIGEF